MKQLDPLETGILALCATTMQHLTYEQRVRVLKRLLREVHKAERTKTPDPRQLTIDDQLQKTSTGS